MILTSVDKGLAIIELISQHPQGLKLSEISQQLGLPHSTAHHLLDTLRQREYIRQDEDTRRYLLGFHFLEISRRMLESLDLRSIARKYLLQISQACGQAVHLAVLNDKKLVYIDMVEARQGLALASYVGFSTDLYAAAGGKVLLAGMSEREVCALYADTPLKPYARNTLTSLGALLQELEQVRQRGYAIDDEEYYNGVRCVSAPIRAGGKVVAALSITGSVFVMTVDKIHTEFKAMVVEAADEISEKLKW